MTWQLIFRRNCSFMRMFPANQNILQSVQSVSLIYSELKANINHLGKLHHKLSMLHTVFFFLLLLLCGYWCILSLLRRKGTASSPQMVVWNKQNPLEEHLSHPLSEARSSSSSSSNQSEHGVTRTGSSPLAVPGRRWADTTPSCSLCLQAIFFLYTHLTSVM